jgi:predicted amidohydrolase
VFPEFSLTGSVDALRDPERAIPVGHAAVWEVVAATARTGVGTVFGIAEREGDSSYITQLFASGGELRAMHRKRRLGEGEEGFSLGGEPEVFQVGRVTCGIVICAESQDPSIWRDLARAGASVIFFCAAPGLSDRRTDEASWRAGLLWWEGSGLADAKAAARANGFSVAVATQAGSTFDEDFPGLAALVSPAGEVTDRTPDWRPGSLVVEIAGPGPGCSTG